MNSETAVENAPSFEEHLKTFVAGCQQIYDKSVEGELAELHKRTLVYDLDKTSFTGKPSRYVRVAVSRDGVGHESVYCFVDKMNGDVLKASSWKAPAKHARGNIFDASNGLAKMGPYGPAYLR